MNEKKVYGTNPFEISPKWKLYKLPPDDLQGSLSFI